MQKQRNHNLTVMHEQNNPILTAIQEQSNPNLTVIRFVFKSPVPHFFCVSSVKEDVMSKLGCIYGTGEVVRC